MVQGSVDDWSTVNMVMLLTLDAAILLLAFILGHMDRTERKQVLLSFVK